MAKECPIGTMHEWSTGWMIKAHEPMQPYSSGWIPLTENAELNMIGQDCDNAARQILTHKEPIDGERFLDHEINEYRDEHGDQPYRPGDFKQYFGFYDAGRYSFRSEFSKRFMRNKSKLSEEINSELASLNEDAGGDRYHDLLTEEVKKEVRARLRRDFKEDPNAFSIKDAEALHDIVMNTAVKLEEGENIKDPEKKFIYDTNKKIIEELPDEYDKIMVKQAIKDNCIAYIKEAFSDNWGICDSFEHRANDKFSEYVRKWKEQIKLDSVEEFKDAFGVTLDMGSDEFYEKIRQKYHEMSESEKDKYNEIFKHLVYIRFATKYNKIVDGDWKLEHVPALENVRIVI